MELDLSALVATCTKNDVVAPDLFDRASAAFAAAKARIEGPDIGFAELPDNSELARRAMECARGLPSEVDTCVVLGIGGSSLGPSAVYRALAHPFDTLRSRSPGMPRRLFFPDNSDPATFRALLETVDLRRTVWNIVTKSGGTAETAAQTLIVIDRIRRELGDDAVKNHVIATTDPGRGALRELSQRLNFTSFEVPPNVGGRFSVLSAVGLVPSAMAGLDVAGLQDGARSMRSRVFSSDDPKENPALAMAALLHRHDQHHARPIVVMMPYADSLVGCADWFKQLWAESLGKAQSLNGELVNVGPTPLTFRGATDQHSLLQLCAEGPDDKVYLSIAPSSRDAALEIPSTDFVDIGSYGAVAGRDMAELIDAQLLGTRASLIGRGRPVAEIRLSRVDASALGEFFFFFEAATAFAGEFYGVDPYDQPGVEEAKKLAVKGLADPDGLRGEISSDERYVY